MNRKMKMQFKSKCLLAATEVYFYTFIFFPVLPITFNIPNSLSEEWAILNYLLNYEFISNDTLFFGAPKDKIEQRIAIRKDLNQLNEYICIN